jgi:hypothetical protein
MKDTSGKKMPLMVTNLDFILSKLEQGVCKRCHATCSSCYGPGPHQCAKSLINSTILKRGTEAQSSVACVSPCERCKENDPNFCTSCILGQNLLDHVNGKCSKLSGTAISGCLSHIRQPDGRLECVRCTFSF